MPKVLKHTPEEVERIFTKVSKKKLILDDHDAAIDKELRAFFLACVKRAHRPVAIVKRMHSLAAYHRNKGRAAARKRHPFKGICEKSGLPLAKEHAQLDELDADLGFAGRVEWSCAKGNGNGKYTCGGC